MATQEPQQAAVEYLLRLLSSGHVDDLLDEKLEAARLLLSINKATPIPGRGEKR